MTTKTLEALEADADRAAAKHQQAVEAAEAARLEADRQRDERLREYDRQLVEGYDDDEMLEEVRRAERDLDAAVADSTLGGAWLAVKVAQLRHAHLSRHAADAAQRTGASTGYATPVANNAAFEELGRAVDRAAARTIGDELDTLDAAREQAGQG